MPGRARSRAFTLVEAAISMVIVAVMLLAAMTAMGVAARDRIRQAELRRGHELCAQLMTEILAQRYVDPYGAAPRSGTDRRSFNSVDDYNGLGESPLYDKANTVLADTTGWRRTASVWSVVPNTTTLALSAGAGDTGLKQITVTTTSPRGRSFTLTALKSKWGPAEQSTPASGLTIWFGATVTVGPERRVADAGTEALNLP